MWVRLSGNRCAEGMSWGREWVIRLLYFSRGLWTWPPWVICASPFYHNKGNAAHSGVSEVFFHEVLQVEETTVKEMDNWKAIPRDNVILKISNGVPIQDGWPTDPITTEIITSRCGLTMMCLFSVISLQQFLRSKFRNMFTENSTCLLSYFIFNYAVCLIL